jgi:hypothetical protein
MSDLLTLDNNTATRVVASWRSPLESRAETYQEIQVAQTLLDRYVDVAVRRAVPRQLETGVWFADLGPAFSGVWAEGASVKECLDQLAEVLEDWVLLKISDQDRDLPTADDIDLTFLVR